MTSADPATAAARGPGPVALAEIEAALGHRFADVELLRQAVTHRSWETENPVVPGHYQRLEFLGDSVLGLIVSERLLANVAAGEGVLSRTRSRVVSEIGLARAARSVGVGAWLRLGVGEERSGGRDRDTLLADVVEAVLAALYLDGGMDAARRWALQVLGGAIDDACSPQALLDPKTALQERLQGEFSERPVYDIVSSTGPAHATRYVARVRFRGAELGRGEGPSKQAAQQAAAERALLALTAASEVTTHSGASASPAEQGGPET